MRTYKTRNLLVLCLLLIVTVDLNAENWPQWRGSAMNGISTETDLPSRWSRTENIQWRLELPGPGGATPCIWKDHIFITSTEGDDLVLIAASTAGKILWKRKVSQGDKVVRGDEGNAASPSPCTDGKYVWVFFTNGALACYDFSGAEIWAVDVQQRFGKFRIAFGMTSTPVLDGDRLYLQLIHGEGNPTTREATVAALDKKTGKTLWKTGRPSAARAENEHSYASPTIYRDQQRAFLLTHGADYIVAHDLDDGHEIWRCGGLHPPAGYDPTLRFVSSPLAIPGLIVVPSAKAGLTLALNPNGAGDITEKDEYRKWQFHITPDVPSPLAVDGIVYLCRQNGNLIALDQKSGVQFYEERTNRDRHRSSPVFADGKIYLCGRNGVVSVCKPGKQFELLAQNSLEEPLAASPAVSNGRIYLRTFNALYAIGKK
ncbi:MAG: PQQ-binding-like beta-propeller repeat protein [Planctomycetota bacterium]|nr:PQQ-binding-like beta-propeller repeat protein [Planctomycetota bacterium]